VARKQRNEDPRVVGDLSGGEFARVPAGLVRITQTVDYHGRRWAILLRDDLTEIPKAFVWLRPSTPVELVTAPAARCDMHGASVEIDPLKGEL